MAPDKKQYGLRNRGTGQIVRVDERHYNNDEEGASSDKWLVYDESFPYLQEDSLGPILRAHFGDELWHRPSYDFFKSHELLELSELDIVVFDTICEPAAAGGADPARFVVEVSRLEFNLVDGVRYQYVARRSSDKDMAALFTPDEVSRLKEVPNISLAILKSDVVDVATEGLAGSILLPGVDLSGLHNPMGIVDVRSVGGVTYGVMTNMVTDPVFHKVISLVDGYEPDVEPWDDCKVAFGFDEQERDSEELLNNIWDAEIRDSESSIWPKGWSINEVDTSGARMVVVFRIKAGVPSHSDGRLVRGLLDKVEMGIDPREEAYGRKMGR